MKALSVRQPWAFLICSGKKKCENRSWQNSIKGRVLIHSPALRARVAPPVSDPRVNVRSAIIGAVTIVGCYTLEAYIRTYGASEFVEGPWCFRLEDPVFFDKPIPLPGALKFFEVPDELVIEALPNQEVS